MLKSATEIGVRIRTLRVGAGLTQDELASHVGVGAGQVVSRWERGLQVPRLNTASAIADALGVPMEALVRDVTDEAAPASNAARVAALVAVLPEAQARAVLMLAKNLSDAASEG